MLTREQHVIAQDRARDRLITMYAVNGQCHGGSLVHVDRPGFPLRRLGNN